MIRPGQVLGLIVAGCALALAGAWLVGRQGSGGAQDAQGPVLPLTQADLNTVTSVRIYKGDGSHATLNRGTRRWTVAERGYAADSGQVRKLLLDLAALQIEEQKTADPGLYPRLAVEDPSGVQAASTGLTLQAAGRQLGLIIGRTSGTHSVFVRVAGQARSLLATPQLAPDADPRHWLDRALLDIPPEQITQAAIEPQDGPAYNIRRAAAGAAADYVLTPLPKGRELADAATLAAQIGALAGLQLDDVRKAGSAPAVAHASFLTRDGLLLELSGTRDAEQRLVAIVASAPSSGAAVGGAPAAVARARDLNARLSGWQFEVPAYRYDALFRPLEPLLKPLPTPASARSPPHSPATTAPAGLPFGPTGAPGGPQSH